MRIKYIKKRSGKIRTIYSVNEEESRKYRDLLSQIKLSEQMLPAAHGFMPKRSIVTNAKPHVNKKMTISMDLSDFFDSIRPHQVKNKIPEECLNQCFLDDQGNIDTVNGAPRQGLPTSPAIANIAAESMDKAILKKLKKTIDIPGIVYTRYADDLSISLDSDSQEHAQYIIAAVTDIIRRNGFKVNTAKTRIQRDKCRREVCGIMVDNAGIHISRRQRRKLRAAQHNLEMANKNNKGDNFVKKLEYKYFGLTEFSKLKEPKTKQDIKIDTKLQLNEARIIARRFRLRAPKKVEKFIKEQELDNAVKITNDPVMFYGMSAYTTGWTSCMNILKGSYAKGVAFWQRHPGVSLAYIDSGETMTIEGVKRPRMKARTLLYILENDDLVYDHIYDSRGHRYYNTTQHDLAFELSKIGAVSLKDYKFSKYKSLFIKGEVVGQIRTPFFDSLYYERDYKDNKQIIQLYI